MVDRSAIDRPQLGGRLKARLGQRLGLLDQRVHQLFADRAEDLLLAGEVVVEAAGSDPGSSASCRTVIWSSRGGRRSPRRRAPPRCCLASERGRSAGRAPREGIERSLVVQPRDQPTNQPVDKWAPGEISLREMSTLEPPASSDSVEEDRVAFARERRAAALEGGGPERVQRIHESGRLTARERIDLLVDPGSWCEIGLFAVPEHRRDDVARPATRSSPGSLASTAARSASSRSTRQSSPAPPRRSTCASRTASPSGPGAKGLPLIFLSDNDGGRLPDLLGWRFSGVPFDFTHVPAVPVGYPGVPRITAVLGPSYGDAALHAAIATSWSCAATPRSRSPGRRSSAARSARTSTPTSSAGPAVAARDQRQRPRGRRRRARGRIRRRSSASCPTCPTRAPTAGADRTAGGARRVTRGARRPCPARTRAAATTCARCWRRSSTAGRCCTGASATDAASSAPWRASTATLSAWSPASRCSARASSTFRR